MRNPFFYSSLLVILTLGWWRVAADGRPDFLNFIPVRDSSLLAEVEKAHNQAICSVDRLIVSLNERVQTQENPVQAWNEHGDLHRWMGRISEESEIQEFTQLLTRLRDRLHKKEVRYLEGDTSLRGRCTRRATNAYVYTSDEIPTVYVCPCWLDLSQKERVSTLVHETIHTFGYKHPKHTDTPLKAVLLARAHPGLARQSPENFESLVEFYICLD